MGLTLLGCAGDFYYNNGQQIEVTPLKTTQEQSKKTKSKKVTYYKTSTGRKIGVTDEILVECQEDTNCTKVLGQYNLNSISKLTDSIFLVTSPSEENIFRLSQKLYDDKGIAKAHPNFIKTKKRR